MDVADVIEVDLGVGVVVLRFVSSSSSFVGYRTSLRRDEKRRNDILREGVDDINAREGTDTLAYVHKNNLPNSHVHTCKKTHKHTQTDRQTYLRSAVYDTQEGVTYDLYTPSGGPLVHAGLSYEV
jgi:hypothetical protein